MERSAKVVRSVTEEFFVNGEGLAGGSDFDCDEGWRVELVAEVVNEC